MSIRTYAQLIADFAANSVRGITSQKMRDFVESVFPPQYQGAKVSHSSASSQDLTASVEALAIFDTVDFDTNGFVNLGSQNTRITIPAGFGGLYYLSATIETVALASNWVFGAIWKNGLAGTRLARDKINTSDAVQDALTWSTTAILVPGDYVGIGVTVQNNAQDLIRSTVTPSPMLSAIRIGQVPA